jgi:LuxR family transcriptional regulator, maltose regulon positive regulatory protein
MSAEIRGDRSLVTPTGDPIMAAKLRIPPIQSWVVTRPRLLEILSRGVDGPLTLVSAPAGSGKTFLACCWAAANAATYPIAWISLDEEDGQPGLFWSYVIAGLAGAGVPVSDVGLPAETGAVEHSLLVRLAACLWEQPQPIVLILDNAQFLATEQTSDEIDFLIRHAGPKLRIVMLSRRDPPLPLHRYRVSGSMTEVRLGQLSFTLAEVRAMSASHGVALPDSTASSLTDRTRGWAAGLRLALLAHLPPGDTTWLLHPDDDQGPIADYLHAEVLDVQSADVRAFLLRTSLVDRLWPSLAVALTGRQDAGRTLADLARAGGFLVSSEDVPGSYECHPLVRGLLRARLHAVAPAELPALHRAAAQWLADHEQPADAIPHAAAAGDWEDAATLVIGNLAVGRLIGPDSGLAGAFAGMPPDVFGPEAATVRAALACSRRDPETCAKHLLQARELVGDGPSDHAWTLHVAVGVLEAVCGSLRGDIGTTLTASSAVEALLSQAPFHGVDVSDLRAVVLLAQSGVLLLAGRLDEAAAAASGAQRLSDRPGDEYLKVASLGRLALVEALRGHLSRALERAREASSLADSSALTADRTAAAEVALAWVHAEQYDLRSATAHADRASLSGGIPSDAVAAGMLALVRARLCRARGDLTGALAELNRVGSRPPADLPSWMLDMLALYRIRLGGPAATGDDALAPLPSEGAPANPWRVVLRAWAKVAVGDTAAASDMVATLRQQPDLPVDVQVDVWQVTTMGHLAKGRQDLGRDALEHGLDLAAPERLRRPVLEAPARLRRFLRQDPRLAERHPWLTDASARRGRATTAVPHGAPPPVIEPLTNKEREVLRHLAALLSTEETARAMLVSVNTVKTHVRGVLRKLAASHRNEAVRRARELGLV